MEQCQKQALKFIDFSQDMLERQALAQKIYAQLTQNSITGANKVAVCGQDGAGKSTFLNFISQISVKEQNILIEFDASLFQEPNELWVQFYLELLQVMSIHHFNLDGAFPFEWNKKILPRFIQEKSQEPINLEAKIKKHIDIDDQNSALLFVSKRLQADSPLLMNLKSKLEGKKVIIILYHFDKFPLKLITEFLYAFKGFLNLSCFAFLLSLDKESLSKKLKRAQISDTHQAALIDNIMSSHFDLPVPTGDQIKNLFKNRVQALIGYSHPEAVEFVGGYLPHNLRKLMAIINHIKVLQAELPYSLDVANRWQVIYLTSILQEEIPNFFHKMVSEFRAVDLLSILNADHSHDQQVLEAQLKQLLDSEKDLLPEEVEKLKGLLAIIVEKIKPLKKEEAFLYSMISLMMS